MFNEIAISFRYNYYKKREKLKKHLQLEFNLMGNDYLSKNKNINSDIGIGRVLE